MDFKVAFLRITVPMFFHIILSYTHYFFILPDLLRTKRLKRYFLRLVPAIAIVMFFQVITENATLTSLGNSNYFESFGWIRFVSTLWDEMSFMIFTGMIKFAVDWFEMENKKKTLENEKLAVELKYLKSQINPHFLFNTLHNLNYLTQIKSDQASEVIVMLSNIMRYMIYDSNKSSVTLRKEIDYIQDYLALEAIRLNNKFDLKFDVTEANDQLEIAPLIFIPFVENAFKHGITDKDEKSWIDIRLSTKENIMYLVVENSIGEKGDHESSGVGLDNVKKRLALGYPGKYTLNIDESEKKFHVSLTLDLT